MRGKEAKRLRQLTGFHPADERQYKRNIKGTITATGARELYQDMKKGVRHG